MQQFSIILSLITLTTLFSCSKDDPIPIQENTFECGTTIDMTWTQTVTSDSLVGDWMVFRVEHGIGTGQTHLFDTAYNIAAPLTLNANGTGMIYSTPLNWTLTTSPNSLPSLRITELDTLFSFPVNFIHNDTAEIHPQTPPQTAHQARFLATAGKSVNGQWEQSHIGFERQ